MTNGGGQPPSSREVTYPSATFSSLIVTKFLTLSSAVIIGLRDLSLSGILTALTGFFTTLTCSGLFTTSNAVITSLDVQVVTGSASSSIGTLYYPFQSAFLVLLRTSSLLPSAVTGLGDIGAALTPFTNAYITSLVSTTVTVASVARSSVSSVIGTTLLPFSQIVSTTFVGGVLPLNALSYLGNATNVFQVGYAANFYVTNLLPAAIGSVRSNLGSNTAAGIFEGLYVSGISVKTSTNTVPAGNVFTSNRYIESSVFYGPVVDASTYMAFSRNGGTNAVGVSYFNSDMTLKHNIEPILPDYKLIRELDFFEFDYIDSGIHRSVGLSAQQVQSIRPDFVNVLNTLQPDVPMLVVYLLSIVQDMEKRISLLELPSASD